MIIPMLCVTIFVILVVWFLLPRVARLMIHTPTAISIFRSEERFSRNAETDLVCRLLLEKKKKKAGRRAEDTDDRHQCKTAVAPCAYPAGRRVASPTITPVDSD